VGQGTTSNITARLSSLGTNLLTINPGSTNTGGTFGAAGSAQSLTVDDATALNALGDLAGVSPELSTQKLLVAGTKNTTTNVLGTTAAYPLVRSYTVWRGSALTDVSVDQKLRVVVVGATTATNLGLTGDSIGTDVLIGGLPFRVVGILGAKGGSGFQDPDDQVLIPVTTMQKYFSGSNAVRTISVSVASAAGIETAKTEITALLRERHALSAAATSDFSILDQAQLLDTASAVSGTLTLLLGGIASISLLVGGIGIMNIMLVSVRERTREIGIRKAVGARGRDILAQFLVEAVTISLLGGLIGVALGLALSAVIGAYAGWGFSLNLATVAVALGFSVFVGIVFGVWPARQAAVLDPIVALRYE
jgi:putative ABC transport system permease protein